MIEESSGNVFQDLGLKDADLLKLKSDFIIKITDIVDELPHHLQRLESHKLEEILSLLVEATKFISKSI